jgi:hypothetical protein
VGPADPDDLWRDVGVASLADLCPTREEVREAFSGRAKWERYAQRREAAGRAAAREQRPNATQAWNDSVGPVRGAGSGARRRH